uniref:Uncharacterized protein n=1 Tax=Glossina pallidipes TaxID=7398 RepID=A0A1B0AEF9_GLOPL
MFVIEIFEAQRAIGAHWRYVISDAETNSFIPPNGVVEISFYQVKYNIVPKIECDTCGKEEVFSAHSSNFLKLKQNSFSSSLASHRPSTSGKNFILIFQAYHTKLSAELCNISGGVVVKMPPDRAVSFGSSKGSMVETLVFETPTPLSEHVEPNFGFGSDGDRRTPAYNMHAKINMEDSGIEVQEDTSQCLYMQKLCLPLNSQKYSRLLKVDMNNKSNEHNRDVNDDMKTLANTNNNTAEIQHANEENNMKLNNIQSCN